jgi:hypothetical protein
MAAGRRIEQTRGAFRVVDNGLTVYSGDESQCRAWAEAHPFDRAAEYHVFQASTGVPGPYRFLGSFAFPPKSLAEANIEAYNNALAECGAAQRALDVVGGACEHCGTPLQYNYVLAGEDDRRFVVGSDCLARLGERTTAIKRAQQALERRNATLLAHERARQEYAAFLARIGADGFVPREALYTSACDLAFRLRRERAERELALAGSHNAWLIEALAPCYGDFVHDMCGQLQRRFLSLHNFSKRQVQALCEIYAKQFGRKGSAAFVAAVQDFAAKSGLDVAWETYPGRRGGGVYVYDKE